LPNVGPYIYDVSISGFTRSSIYIYDISSLRVNKIIISEPDVKIINTAKRNLMKRKFKVEGFVI